MAVYLSHHRDDIGKLAEELEIKPELLYRWRRVAKKAKEGAFPGHGNQKMTEEQKEISRLKKYTAIYFGLVVGYDDIDEDGEKEFWLFV